MAFAYQANDTPNVNNYDEALAAHAKARQWRDNPFRYTPLTNPRKMGKSDKTHHCIGLIYPHAPLHLPPVAPRGGAGACVGREPSVAFRYHSTNVVVYHPDGSIELGPYASPSTDNFAARLTPTDMVTYFNRGQRANGHMLVKLSNVRGQGAQWWGSTNARIYALSDSVGDEGRRFKRDDNGVLQPMPGAVQPFTVPRVDTRRSREALGDAGFYDFQHWLRATWAMHGSVAIRKSEWGETRAPQIVERLLDRGQWMNFVESEAFHVECARYTWSRGAWGREPMRMDDFPRYSRACIAKTLLMVRLAVYETHKTVLKGEREYCENLREVNSIEALASKYDWL